MSIKCRVSKLPQDPRPDWSGDELLKYAREREQEYRALSRQGTVCKYRQTQALVLLREKKTERDWLHDLRRLGIKERTWARWHWIVKNATLEQIKDLTPNEAIIK